MDFDFRLFSKDKKMNAFFSLIWHYHLHKITPCILNKACLMRKAKIHGHSYNLQRLSLEATVSARICIWL